MMQFISVEDVDDILFRFSDIVLKGFGVGLKEIRKIGIISRAHHLGCRNRRQIRFDSSNYTGQGEIDVGQLILKVLVDVFENDSLQLVGQKSADGRQD